MVLSWILLIKMILGDAPPVLVSLRVHTFVSSSTPGSHMCRVSFFAALLISTSLTGAASAQVRGLVSEIDAQRLGLERAWFTRVAIDGGQGRIADVSQHVSSTKAYNVHQVHYDGGKVTFSERDVNRYGELLGDEMASKLAQRRVEELEDAGLNPKLETRAVPAVTLYASTNRGVVHAIDGETGRTLWVANVGRPGQAIETPGASDKYVGVVSRGEVFLLSAEDGKVVWQRKVRGAPSGGAVLTDELLFAPMLGGKVEVYELKDHLRAPWVFQPTGRSVQPIFNGRVVAWPTDRGHLYVLQANVRNALYQVELSQSIEGQATALHPGRLLAASTDGYVYCIEEEAGAILWRFSTGERISQSCMVVGEAIYAVTEGSHLFRISGKTGYEDWPVPTAGVQRILSISTDRLYCLDQAGRLLMVDANSGAKLGAFNSITPDLRIPNIQTDRIFLGTHSGIIQCLHETRNEFPVLHLDAVEAAATEEAGQSAAESAAPPAAPSTDPFGNPIPAPATDDVDPFNTDTDNPFGTPDPGAASDDPFATDPSLDDPFAP